MRKRALHTLAVGGASAALALALWGLGALDRLELATWSWRASAFAPRRRPCAAVKVVLLDQASLAWAAAELGWPWPWPREAYAALLDFLRRGGARVVAVDLLFTEPSLFGVEDDAALGAAIRRTERFVGAAFRGRDGPAWPIPAVATNASALANVKDEPDPDGVFRRATLFDGEGTNRMPAFAYAAWRLAAGPEAPDAAAPPLDARNRLLLQFRGPGGRHETYGLAALLQSELRLREGRDPLLEPAVFSNACVLVGLGAPGLMDVRATPVSRVCPGVEIHATALDNLLTRSWLRDVPPWAVALYLAALGCAAAGLVLAGRLARHTAAAAAVCLPLPAGLAFLAYAAGFWLPLVAGVAAAALALFGATLLNYATVGRQKAFIRRAFRHYLGEEVIERLLADPSRLTLGGEKREVTVFFSDVEGFSTFSERLDPQALTALLNDYLSEMSAIVTAEGGYLDKYIGDAIVAFWNAPADQPDHAARACRAAIRCQRRLAERRPEYARRFGVELRARIGLNTGVATVGNMGSRERFNYTLLGDAANLAARLEGANKAFGTYTLVAESTWARSGGAWLGRELARLRVVGRAAPVRVYELAGFAGEPAPEAWADFAAGRALAEAGRPAEARACFARRPEDAASRAYAERCARLAAGALDADGGVWALTEK